EVKVPEVSLGWRRQPGKYTRNHDQAYQEEGHDVNSSNNTKFTEDEDIRAEQGKESNRDGEVGQKCGKPHFQHDSSDRLFFVLCPGELYVEFIQQIDCVGNSDRYNNRRDQPA